MSSIHLPNKKSVCVSSISKLFTARVLIYHCVFFASSFLEITFLCSDHPLAWLDHLKDHLCGGFWNGLVCRAYSALSCFRALDESVLNWQGSCYHIFLLIGTLSQISRTWLIFFFSSNILCVDLFITQELLRTNR